MRQTIEDREKEVENLNPNLLLVKPLQEEVFNVSSLFAPGAHSRYSEVIINLFKQVRLIYAN